MTLPAYKAAFGGYKREEHFYIAPTPVVGGFSFTQYAIYALCFCYQHPAPRIRPHSGRVGARPTIVLSFRAEQWHTPSVIPTEVHRRWTKRRDLATELNKPADLSFPRSCTSTLDIQIRYSIFFLPFFPLTFPFLRNVIPSGAQRSREIWPMI